MRRDAGPPISPGILKRASDWHARMAAPDDVAEVEAFEAWLAADPLHARAYDQFERLGQLGGSAALRLAIKSDATATRVRRFPAAAGFAAALALVVASALWIYDGAPSAQAAVNNPGPAVRGIRLRSGVVILLDEKTRLLVSTASSANEVTLQSGRARFKVRQQNKVPLTVISGGIAIVAETATFDVTRRGEDVTIAVMDGGLSAQQTHPTREATPIAPGEGVATRAGSLEKISGLSDDLRWPDRRVQFDNVPLRDVMTVVNRRGGSPILLADPTAANLRVSGTLDLTDPHALARKLSSALDLQLSETPTGILLRR